ncbi:hypothetical protein DB891_09570 [Flavobacterium laiguense]|uniref:Uncharacterized protein n=1 Tax=Flavobacterium laiguense TaxID=2169409 RepID=A0A2U1JVE6_9FLAO|nr:hypothetical protein DB891_09570 [Flavobacterium laiguense]
MQNIFLGFSIDVLFLGFKTLIYIQSILCKKPNAIHNPSPQLISTIKIDKLKNFPNYHLKKIIHQTLTYCSVNIANRELKYFCDKLTKQIF